jgi:pyridoxal phosphate enzyme (YggS family)
MPRQQLRDNLARVEERIAQACARAGRRRAEVTLVAVTKSVTPDIAALLPELGVVDLGENRPQELWRKAEAITGVRWHLIGHLQRNKIERTLPLVTWIHSVDSVRLLQAIDQQASAPIEVLLEVNASGEASKSGFALMDILTLAPIINELKRVQVRGLMTMAALQDAEACRPTFIRLREARDQVQAQSPGHRLEHLSMGMSNDFEIAIEEGATFIRLGTALYEGIEA